MRTLLSKTYHWYQGASGKLPSRSAIRRHEALLRSDPDTLARHRMTKLRELLRHAATHVPYYRECFKERGIDVDSIQTLDDLSALPLLDKRTIRAAGDAMRSETAVEEELRHNASGGSTGEPLHFLQDRRYQTASSLSTATLNEWTGWRHGETVALLWGAPADNARFNRERLRNQLKNRFLVDAFDITDERLAEAVELFRRRKPVLVLAYASVAYVMASYLRRERIRLRHPPRAVLCSAEVLVPAHREIIETEFGCKAYNRYGSREVGTIAMECSEGSLHINATEVIVEVPEPGPDGVGELVITQLNNWAFPFIRYRIGDLGGLAAGQCACGRHLPVLTGLQGRVGDYIVAPDGTRIHGEWFTHLFYEVKGVSLFTFRQTGRRDYVFEIERDTGLSQSALDAAMSQARDKLGPQAQVDVHYVEKLEKARTGKHRFVVNEWQEDAPILTAESS